MKIPEKERKKGVELYLINANNLINNAKLLLEKGSHGYASFLALTSIEETSKAFMLAYDILEDWESKEFKKHKVKFTVFVAHLLGELIGKQLQRGSYGEIEKPLNVDDFKEISTEIEAVYDVIWKHRLKGIYVDFIEGKWSSPYDIRLEDAKEDIEYAEKYKTKIEMLCKNILDAPEDVIKNLHKSVKKMLGYMLTNYKIHSVTDS